MNGHERIKQDRGYFTDNIKMAVEVMFRSFPADIGTYQDIPYPVSSGAWNILRLCRCRNAIGRGWIA